MSGAIMGKWIMVFGAMMIAVGALFYFGLLPGKLGHLPGDINLRREGYNVSVPIVTCVVISIILTIVLNLLFRMKR